MLATTLIDQLKSVKDSSYLRPRIHVRLNFTNLLICNSSECQVTTYTEPFTAFSSFPLQYRTRTCDLRLYADALTTELTEIGKLQPSAFLFCGPDENRTHHRNIASVSRQSLGTCQPINETVFRDFTDGLFPITCCVATQSRVPKQSTLGHSNSR